MKLPSPDPLAAIEIWHSADYRADDWPDFPLYAFQYEELLEHCSAALAARRDSYPGLVERGVITERDAADDISGWELIVEEWRWICTGDGRPPAAGSLPLRRTAVDLALERVGQAFSRGLRQHDLYRQAHFNMALRWHLNRLKGGVPAVHALAAFSRELRAEAANQRRAAA